MNKYQEAYSYIKHYCELDDDFLKWPLAERSIKILQELVDKETPKKPRIEKVLWAMNSTSEQYIKNHYCPNCNEPLNKFKHNYCNRCGCKIDWSEEDE